MAERRKPQDPGPQDAGEAPDRGLALEEARPRIAKPPMFKVVLLNDDYTPMEFVVEVLQRFFRMDRHAATR